MRDAIARPADPFDMLTLRGDLEIVGRPVAEALGAQRPAPRMHSRGPASTVHWMSPDELLVTCGAGQGAAVARDLRAATADAFATIVDMSDARVTYDLTGPDARDALATLTPADLGALGPSETRRTRLAQIPAAFWAIPDGYRIVAFRSVEVYLRDVLDNATGARPAVQAP